MAKRERVFAGLYSGPSADGAEAALVSITGKGARMKARQVSWLHRPMPTGLRKRLRRVSSGWAATAGDLAGLDRDVGAFLVATFRAAAKKARLARSQIAGIGLLAQPAGYVRPTPSDGSGSVMELGSPATVAHETQLPVVGGFRQSDLAAGGVGGPVTAWPDWLLFRDGRLSRVVVQLGAIASITFVGSAAAACEVVAYDTGPGTILVDTLTESLFSRLMDEDGAIAARGRVSEALLNELMAGEYLQREPPKQTHPLSWSGATEKRLEMIAGKHRCRAVDLVATVTELTAHTIARAVLGLTERPHEVILAGGGAKNIHLAGRIRALLSPSSTYAVERYGVGIRAHGAACCAVLAAARTDEFPAHCHAATGADRPVVLGSIWLP